jgi:hypothetical protein
MYRIKWFFTALSHYLSLFILRFYGKNNQVIFICGAPRSGTSWVSDVIALYYNLPRPKHYLLPVLFDSVIHTHVILDPVKYKNVVYVQRNGLNAYLSWYRAIKNRILHHKKFVGMASFKRAFRDVTDINNTSYNVKKLIEIDNDRRDGIAKKITKIKRFSLGQLDGHVDYEAAILDPLMVFSNVITKISGECDNTRLDKVLSLLDKKAQQTLSEQRRSTIINVNPSSYEGVITQDVIDYYESIINSN